MSQKSLNSIFLAFMFLVIVYINFYYSSAKALVVGGAGALIVVEKIGVAGGLTGSRSGPIGIAIGAAAGYAIEERNQNYQANQAEAAARNNPSDKVLERNAKESRELADSWWR